MRKMLLFAVALLVAAPAAAQVPGALRKAASAKDAYDSLTFSPAERTQLGQAISAKLRDRYGVVQDAKVTKYVSLVGLTVAKGTPQPELGWQFSVLDTDAINAYATPGGFIHITRGALGFITNEAELAGVLGHEIGHVIGDHTIAAIRKGKMVDLAGNLTRSQVLDRIANKAYEMTFENAFDRGDEVDADKIGVQASGKAGYQATAISGFLTRLGDRNKGNPDRNGLFASHPVITERVGKIEKVAKDGKLTSAAAVQARYAANVSYKPIPMSAIATVAPPATATADAKPAESKKPGLGLSRLKGAVSGGSQTNSTALASSAGARGVTPDRDAKGGPNKAAVRVTVTAADLAAFKAGIA